MNFIFRDGFNYFLYHLISINTGQAPAEGFNLKLIFFAAIIFLVITSLFLKLYKKEVSFKNYDPAEYEPKFRKFRGVLLFVCLLLLYDFIKNIYELYSYSFLFSDKTNFFLTDIKAPFLANWWVIIIYYIVFFSVFKLVFSFFNLFFLIRRKRYFKYMMLFYIPACIILEGLRYALITQVVERNDAIIYTVFSQWSESIYLSIVLFAYFFFSRRVNAALSK